MCKAVSTSVPTASESTHYNRLYGEAQSEDDDDDDDNMTTSFVVKHLI